MPNAHIRGSGCPTCVNKTEGVISEFLEQQKIKHDKQFAPKWLINSITNKKRRFDFTFHKQKMILELDGEQHFSQVSNWDPPELQQSTDVDKMFLAIEHGYSVIRLLQQDVFDNLWDWKGFILNLLTTRITKSIEPEIIYQDSPKYNNHELLFFQEASKRYV
jgi:hypothetical protein